jgi:hypothetical protein
MDRSLHPPLLQNRACGLPAHGSSVMRPLSSGICAADKTAIETRGLMVRAFPLRGIAPSRRSAGSSACSALLRPITCPSPSSRLHIRGIPPSLGCLRNPARHAMRLTLTHAPLPFWPSPLPPSLASLYSRWCNRPFTCVVHGQLCSTG